jgi:uncharacterized membrane protein YoaK (UPF0700 family)
MKPFLYIYDLPNSTSGIDTITTQTITAVPAFTPLFLLFIFFLVFIGGSSRQKAKTGTADFPLWSVVSSISALLVALLMSTITGIIQLQYLIIVVVVTIFTGVWFFLDRKQSEV